MTWGRALRAVGRIRFRLIVGCVAPLVAPPLAVAEDGTVRPRIETVVYSGQPVPGAAGLQFVVPPADAAQTSQNFLISPTGRVVFQAGLSGTATSPALPSLWTWQAGTLAPVARAGDPMPGGGTFSNFGNLPAINRAGDVAFVGAGGAETTGLFLASPAGPTGHYGLRSILRSGDILAGETVARVFEDVNPVLNNTGQVSFAVGMESQAQNGGATFLTTAGGQLSTLLRAGRPDPAGITVGGAWIYGIDDRGRTTILPTGPAYDGSTIYHGTPGNLRPIAGHGTPVPDPGMEGDVFKGSLGPAVDQNGLHALMALTERSHGVWLGDADGVRLVAARGQAAPGIEHGTFGGFFGAVGLNTSGRVALTGSVDDIAPHSVHGIWSGSPGNLQKVIAQGDPLPGTDRTLGDLTFSSPHLSERGDVAFLGSFEGTSFTNDLGGDGLWAGQPADVHLVALRGDLVELAPGLEKTIDRLYFAHHHLGGRMPTAFSDAGDLLFEARFTDGTYALLTAQVPEPAWLAACAMGFLPVLLRRRRLR